MIATPNDLVDILGGADTTSEYGDPIEGTQTLAADVPAAIIAGRRVVLTESDPQATVVHYYTGRLPHGTAVDASNRLRSKRTGDTYVVDYVETPTNPIIPSDVRLDLRRVT